MLVARLQKIVYVLVIILLVLVILYFLGVTIDLGIHLD